MQDENVQLTKMISNLENSSILVLVNKKSYFFINLLLKTDYKVNVMNYENIFLAIQALFDDSDIASKEDANSFITQWQLSPNSIEDSIEILSTIEEPHVIFVMIKTIQTYIRFYWNKISDKLHIIIELLLNLLTKDYISQIHRDFIFICLSDISNQTGDLNENMLNSIPKEFILRFFSFFFENWYEPFIQHLIQPNFISIGFEMLQENEIGNEWFRIMKVLSSEIHEFDCFSPFFSPLIDVDISIDENRQFLNEIISNLCNLNYQDLEQFSLFLEFFINCSKKFASPFLWIPFFEIRATFFDMNEENFMKLIEIAMNEFFESCTNEEFEYVDSNLFWIDLISVSFSFLIELNSNYMNSTQLNYLNLISHLLDSILVNDEEISSILSNLHLFVAFNEFVQNEQKSLSFYSIIAYNSNFLPFEMVQRTSSQILSVEEVGKDGYLLLSIIEKNYSLLKEDFSDQFLMKINELFPLFEFKSSKVLYFIVSKNYASIDESFFELFHQYIQFNSPFVIPSLLYLLKEEKNEFFNEIDNKISEMMNESNVYDFLLFISSMIKKFPKDGFPFLSSFFNEFSIKLIDLLIQISIELNDDVINNKIVDIFSIILKKEYLADLSCFINWIDNLMTIEDKITEYHIDFLSNFDVFSFENLNAFLEKNLINLHELSYENLNQSELFSSIIELMLKTSFERPVEMWSIFPIQYLFDAFSFKNSTVLNKARIIVSNNIQDESAPSFINLLISHLFSDENKMSVIFLLSSISRKMNEEKYVFLVVNSFPYKSDILDQFVSVLMNSLNIPQLLLLAQQLIQSYS